jgi:hypothetical protein
MYFTLRKRASASKEFGGPDPRVLEASLQDAWRNGRQDSPPKEENQVHHSNHAKKSQLRPQPFINGEWRINFQLSIFN